MEKWEKKRNTKKDKSRKTFKLYGKHTQKHIRIQQDIEGKGNKDKRK